MTENINRRKFFETSMKSSAFFLGAEVFNMSSVLKKTSNNRKSDIRLNRNETLVFYGDSLTSGTGGLPYGLLVGRALPERKIVIDAIGGQDSFAIAGRQGGVSIVISLEGNSFKGTQSIKISRISNEFLSTPASLKQIEKRVIIEGINCKILRTGKGSLLERFEEYTITPDISTFTAVPEDTVVILPEAVEMKSATQILWFGRNDLSESSAEKNILENLERSIQFISYPRQYLVLGVLSGVKETKDTSAGIKIMDINKKLESIYHNFFIPMNPPTSLEMMEIGYIPTSTDKKEIENLTFPSAFRFDSLHLNTKGYTIVANRVIAKLKELQF